MAGADYRHCAVCYKRVFYDADIDYGDAAEVLVLCVECAKGYTLIPVSTYAERHAAKIGKKSE
jgi:hypothetical protein